MPSDRYGEYDDWTRKNRVAAPVAPPKETNPDRRRATSRVESQCEGPDIKVAYEVPGLGVFVMHSRGSDPETGRLTEVGFSLFTTEEVHARR